MALTFPCIQVSNLIRLDPNRVQVQGLLIYLDENANGAADSILAMPDFIVTGNPLDTAGKIGAQIVNYVNAVLANRTAQTAPPPPEAILAAQTGKTWSLALAQVSDPTVTAGAIEPGVVPKGP